MKNITNYRSESPRTRENQKYPGGKQLRRRLAALAARKATFVSKPANTMPGSMRG